MCYVIKTLQIDPRLRLLSPARYNYVALPENT